MHHALTSFTRAFGIIHIFSIMTACISANPPLHPQTAQSSGELSSLQAQFDVQHYRLAIQVDPQSRSIEGRVSMTALATQDLSNIELDLDPRFEILETEINGVAVSHETVGGKLILQSALLHSGEEFNTLVAYRGKPYEAENPPWDGGFVWEQTESGEHWIATAVQGRGCDLYWPCKDHISDKPERGADMLITVPAELVAVMNGRLIDVQTEGEYSTYHWQTENPISAYHLALNIGPFQEYTLEHSNSITENAIPLIFYHVTNDMPKIEKLIKQDFVSQLAFFEKTLGPYPWGEEKIGIVEIPYLGMEHQTMNGYGNEFRLDPRGFDWLMQHEFSHEWFGNLMTQKDSRDFWLHEGFANYMQPVYAQQVIGDAAYWSYMWDAYNGMANCKPVVPEESVSMDYFDSNDPYYKGSWTLHTLRGLVGEDVFWRSVRRLIYDTPDPWSLSYPIAPTRRSSEDFVRIVSEEHGEDLTWFFAMYLGKGDVPVLEQRRTSAGIALHWAGYDEAVFDVPVQIIQGNDLTEVLVPTTGEIFPIPADADIQIDPHVTVFRDFGTTEACTVD